MSSKTMLDFDEAMDEAEQKQSAERERKRNTFAWYIVLRNYGKGISLRRGGLSFRVLYIRKPWKYKFKRSPPA